jgi:hypothetical protein
MHEARFKGPGTYKLNEGTDEEISFEVNRDGQFDFDASKAMISVMAQAVLPGRPID